MTYYKCGRFFSSFFVLQIMFEVLSFILLSFQETEHTSVFVFAYRWRSKLDLKFFIDKSNNFINFQGKRAPDQFENNNNKKKEHSSNKGNPSIRYGIVKNLIVLALLNFRLCYITRIILFITQPTMMPPCICYFFIRTYNTCIPRVRTWRMGHRVGR